MTAIEKYLTPHAFNNGISLELERNGVISGSRVPRIEAHINFLKSLIEMVEGFPNPLDYAEHINRWQQEIEWARQDKQDEMKRNFTGWMD